jgi:phosphoribosyl 1,2-cyclic phosphate phosphodiesterase
MLGSGTSSGVPRVGGDRSGGDRSGGDRANGDWGLCDPKNPKNRRRRVSVLVEAGETRLLVDTGPDLREQLLDAGVCWLTAVLYTHDHADHCHGIDDLRAIFHASGVEVDCYMDKATRAGLKSRFAYVFGGRFGYPPTAKAHLVEPEMRFGSILVRPFRQHHGPVNSLGFRFEADGCAVAYSTDLNAIPEESWPLLDGLDLWVVDALRRNPHPTHSHLAQTLEWIARAAPKSAWLTHMDQSMDHDTLLQELPADVSPGFDGRVWEGGR